MKIEREFCPADRYVYDNGACSYKNGFAQIDTRQDASYYGQWCSPTRLMIVSYCEGDVTISTAETAEEFATALRDLNSWNIKAGYGDAKIDPGFDPAMKAAFESLGLGDLLH